MLLQRGGEPHSPFDIPAHLSDDFGERFGLRLLLQHRQGSEKRESGVDHCGELAAEDGNVFRLHPIAETRDIDLHLEARGFDFIHRQRDGTLLPKGLDDGVL